jgi:ribosomal protein S18 acetylase RimI-like enzyme
MLFYRARPVGGTLRAGDDAVEAQVFQPGEIPLLPFRTHREMIADWLAGRVSQAARAETPAEMPAFVIRDAESGDANEIAALLSLIPANRALTPEDWRSIYQRFRELDGIHVFVAVTTQQPAMVIGFLALSVVRSLTEGRGLINDMAVLPTFQRRGVGAALLEAAMRRSQRLQLRSLLVNVSRANDSVKAFYASLGFAEGEVMQLKLR